MIKESDPLTTLRQWTHWEHANVSQQEMVDLPDRSIPVIAVGTASVPEEFATTLQTLDAQAPSLFSHNPNITRIIFDDTFIKEETTGVFPGNATTDRTGTIRILPQATEPDHQFRAGNGEIPGIEGTLVDMAADLWLRDSNGDYRDVTSDWEQQFGSQHIRSEYGATTAARNMRDAIVLHTLAPETLSDDERAFLDPLLAQEELAFA